LAGLALAFAMAASRWAARSKEPPARRAGPIDEPAAPTDGVDGIPVQGSRHRKRLLIAHLVAWANKKGAPFDARPEPTPAHVRDAAGRGSPVGVWADTVEQAAFGGEDVDEPRRAEIDRLAPSD
jgi:hypothetical protein